MKILIVGDSFVQDGSTKSLKTSYAWLAKKQMQEIKFDIIGMIGAGNFAIGTTVLESYKNHNAVIINWSGISRYDLIISDKTKKKLFQKPHALSSTTTNLMFTHSGGPSSYQLHTTGETFKNLYKYHYDDVHKTIETLQMIMLVNLFLDKIPVLNLFSYDCQLNLEEILQKYKWTNFIPWEKFWFHKNKSTNTGGIIDWCYDNSGNDLYYHPNTDKDPKGRHPTNLGHAEFSKKILVPWINKLND